MKVDPEILPSAFATRHRDRVGRLGWFVAGALLIVIAAALFMSVQKDLFKRTTQLHSLVDSAKGMVPGMAVKLNGFRIGSLARLVMDENGRVSMMISVSDEYVHLIHKDARARLSRESLIGENIIELQPGSAKASVVENNALIAFERARDASDELSKLAEQLQPILADVKNITAYIDSQDGDLKQTLRELKRTTTALANSGEDLNGLLRHNKQQINAAIDGAAHAVTTLDNSLPLLIERLDTSLRNVEGVTADARVITSKLAVELPPVVVEGRTAISEGRTVLNEGLEAIEGTNEMLDAVKGSWPLNRLMPQQEINSLPLDSHVPYRR